MVRGEDAQWDDVDILDVGPKRAWGGGGWPGQRWPRWLPFVLAGVIVAAAVIAAVAQEKGSSSESPAAHRPTTGLPSSTEPSTSTPSPSGSEPPAVTVTAVGHPLLGVTAGWELFARGDGVMIRVQLAQGRITRTTIPTLLSTGPVSFFVGPGDAIIRPSDAVPGYLVPDRRPARALPGVLGGEGTVLPGPSPDQVWMQTGSAQQSMTLVGRNGQPTGVSIPIPADEYFPVVSDGAGYVLFSGTGGVYDARPDGLHRVSTGTLQASGPTRWLVSECDERHRCGDVVIDRTTGTRHAVDPPVADQSGTGGLISPNGTTVAFLRLAEGETATLHLQNLTSGNDRRVGAAIDRPATDGTTAWSPDSRWLFVIGAGGKLLVIDPRTAAVRPLGVSLPPLNQLAIRNAPR